LSPLDSPRALEPGKFFSRLVCPLPCEGRNETGKKTKPKTKCKIETTDPFFSPVFVLGQPASRTTHPLPGVLRPRGSGLGFADHSVVETTSGFGKTKSEIRVPRAVRAKKRKSNAVWSQGTERSAQTRGSGKGEEGSLRRSRRAHRARKQAARPTP
jgi:hypothetical protein